MEYFFKRLYSADHLETVGFTHMSDMKYCMDICELIGGKFVVENTQLADLLGIEPTEKAEAKRVFLEVCDAGDHIFGINAGDHSGYWFHFVDGLASPDHWDGFRGLNFLVVNRKQFLRAFPGETSCRKYVQQKVVGLEDYFQSSINGWLVEFSYQGKDQSYVFGPFTTEEAAVAEAAYEFPHIKYSAEDFEVIGYRLKQSAA